MTIHTTHDNVPQHHPRVAHYKPYWFNDSLGGIDKAKKQKYLFIDQDGHCVPAHNDLGYEGTIKHWGLPEKDGFKYIWTGKRTKRGREIRRRLTRAERRKTLEQWGWEALTRLRSSRFGKSRLYLSVATHMRKCALSNVTMCLEAKGSDLWRERRVWQYFKRVQEKTNCDVIVMTLMYGPTPPEEARQRLAMAHAAGFPTVLLVHGWKKPADWNTRWAMHVDAVWGWWAK